MTGRNVKLGGLVGLAALTVGALSVSSCDEVADQCGLSCPDQGVVQGNASITGYIAVDSFFRSVVNFNAVARGVSSEIDAELRGIQTLFGLTDAEASADLGAAIRAKLQSTYMATVQVKAQPARCSVDASIAARVTAECQAQADCMVDPGQARFECMGTCTVEASASGGCEANADVRCEVSGPSVACQGECSGTCSVMLSAAAACDGTCVGTCMGTCAGDTDQGAGCNGQCMGMCQGRCELSAMAALNCNGTCNGSCEYTPPNAMCAANANVSCDLKAEAKAQCNGRCEGEFKPPQAMCNASASCEASARAEAKFQATCTPPSVEVRVVSSGGAMVQAQVDYLVAQLRVRLPALRAAQARAQVVSEAGAQLVNDGKAAVQASIGGFASGELDAVAAYRIASCAPNELNVSAMAIQASSMELQRQMTRANQAAGALGMTGT